MVMDFSWRARPVEAHWAYTFSLLGRGAIRQMADFADEHNNFDGIREGSKQKAPPQWGFLFGGP